MLALLGMLSATIGGLGKEDSKTHGNLLLDIFLTCLDYRTQETKVPLICRMCALSGRVHCHARAVYRNFAKGEGGRNWGMDKRGGCAGRKLSGIM